MSSDAHRIVAFVGLGAMGTPMTRRLVEAQYEVIGYDVSSEARDRVAQHGVTTVDQLGSAIVQADVVITMLPDANVVESVLTMPEVVAGLSATTMVIDMSSSEPLRTRALAEQLDERGVRMVDAPVSGGVLGAVNGKLTVMAGGSSVDVDEVRPLLDVFGRVVHAGPIGAGHAIKALNNLLSATHLLSASEAMHTGELFGLNPEVMLEIFNSSSGRSGSTENKFPNFILPGTFNSGFGLHLMLKDMKIAVQLANQVGATCELGREAVAIWSEAASDLSPKADHTEIARWLKEGAKDGTESNSH